jgi:predicted TIM-barrel fold metal-dependent hydrolase
MKVFDSITHVTDDGHWFGRAACEATVDRLISEMDGTGAERACLVAIAGTISNDTVWRCSRACPDRLVPIGSLNPVEFRKPDEVAEAVRHLSAQRFAGLKLHPRWNDYDPLDPRCVAAIQSAGDEGLPVFLDTLFHRRSVPVRNPVEIVENIAISCPSTTVVLLHGCGSSALDLFEIVRSNPRLVLDLSFTLMRYAGSSVDLDIRFLFEQLDQRVTIGSDFPEVTLKSAFARASELMRGLPDEKRANVCYRNLERIFPIGGDEADRPV